jgi:hypothetical protein
MAALCFLRQLQPGNVLAIASVDGKSLGVSIPIPQEWASPDELDELLTLAEDLILLQENASWGIPLPESLPPETDRAIRQAGRLLRGERIVGHWSDIKAHVLPEGIAQLKELLASPCAVVVGVDMAIRLPGGEVPVGRIAQRVHSAVMRAGPEWDDEEGSFLCVIEPGTNNLMEMALAELDADPRS